MGGVRHPVKGSFRFFVAYAHWMCDTLFMVKKYRVIKRHLQSGDFDVMATNLTIEKAISKQNEIETSFVGPSRFQVVIQEMPKKKGS